MKKSYCIAHYKLVTTRVSKKDLLELATNYVGSWPNTEYARQNLLVSILNTGVLVLKNKEEFLSYKEIYRARKTARRADKAVKKVLK